MLFMYIDLIALFVMKGMASWKYRYIFPSLYLSVFDWSPFIHLLFFQWKWWIQGNYIRINLILQYMIYLLSTWWLNVSGNIWPVGGAVVLLVTNNLLCATFYVSQSLDGKKKSISSLRYTLCSFIRKLRSKFNWAS